ncbi:MAG TPA: FG-GAP-like repeat-containing protein [Terriglobales bacterium]|nr:FG-GAP-like repeat-containing protein [Terriglobales bacterium]
MLIGSTGWGQQFRQGSGDPNLAKAAIERHFQSLHPKIPTDVRQPAPGKYLLSKEASRQQLLRSRLHKQSNLKAASHKPASATYPGIQLRPFIPAGSISNSVVAGDFNRDGHMDFAVANGGTNDIWVYLGNGDGTFQLPKIVPLTQGIAPVFLATADLRGNGIQDLVVAEFDTSTVGVLLGNGDGTFGFEQEYVLPQPPGALVINDFNHDGKLDIVSVMVTLDSNQLGVPYLATLPGDGKGGFGAPVISMNPGFYSTADSVVSGDVNGDGLPDVLISGPGLENSQVYINAGNGTFTPGATIIGNGDFNLILAGALADVNGDGCLDALVADGNGYVWVAAGDCKGDFAIPSTVPMGDSNASIAVVDMNGDGNLDIVTTTISLVDPMYGQVAGNMMAVSFGDGRGNFASGRDYVGTGMSYSAAVADFNGDGHPDVVSASPDTDTATVYVNDGSGGFGFPQGGWIGLPGVGVLNAPLSAPSFADVNGDGKPDMVLLDEGYNGEYFITTMLNDGTGRFSGPIPSDAGISITSNWMGDYRLGAFRNTGHLDFVGISLGPNSGNGSPYILFAPGNGDGTFGNSTLVVTPGAAGEMAVGDFNGDGKLDFVAGGGNPNGAGWVITTFLGNGDGTFRNGGSVSFSDSSSQIARVFTTDVNRDGRLDILVYDNGSSSSVWEFLGNGDGTFQTGQQLFTNFSPLTLADVNGDSWLDIVSYDSSTPTLDTYLDQPLGSFSLSSSLSPYTGAPLPVQPYAQFGDPLTSSIVADLNGDGKPDEVAFQYVVPLNGDIYAQILAGNGDGTFTPTYDVFDFQKLDGFPTYTHILDGTGTSDLVEIDGATSSMHVFKGGVAPALQLTLAQAEVIGSTGCGWVLLNVPSASDTSIALSSSVSGVSVPAAVTVPAGSVSQQFCFTLAQNYDWHQVFDIRAQLGSDTAVAYNWQDYTPGFGEAISPTTPQVVYPGQSSSPVTVSLTAAQGYTSTVTLSCQGLPTGATCVFATNPLHVSPAAVASTTVVINTAANSPMGGGAIQVVASDGNITTRQSFTFNIQPLTVSQAIGLTGTISPGTATGTVGILGIPPYSSSCSGLPAGVTCAFSGTQEPYPQSTDLTITVTVPAGIAPGAYPFNVNVKSGPAKASAGFTLYVGDFTLQAPPASSDWVPPGGSITVGTSITPLYGFTSTVNVTCSLNVSGSTCSGGQFQVAGFGMTSISLTLAVPSTTPPGAQTLTITGTDGTLTHTASFPFYVADYTGSIGQNTVTVSPGNEAPVTVTVNVTNGFDGVVTYGCSAPSEIACSFSVPFGNPTPTSPATTTAIISANSRVRRPSNLRSQTNGFLWLVATAFPFAIFVGASVRKKMGLRGSLLLVFVCISGLGCLSCGGGGSNGGGGGGNTYSVAITATVSGTNTSRTLGIVKVTVPQ